METGGHLRLLLLNYFEVEKSSSAFDMPPIDDWNILEEKIHKIERLGQSSFFVSLDSSMTYRPGKSNLSVPA